MRRSAVGVGETKEQLLERELARLQQEYSGIKSTNQYKRLAELTKQTEQTSSELVKERRNKALSRHLLELEDMKKQHDEDYRAMQVYYRKLKAKTQEDFSKRVKQQDKDHLERIKAVEERLNKELDVAHMIKTNLSAAALEYQKKELQFSKQKKFEQAEKYRLLSEKEIAKEIAKLSHQKTIQISLAVKRQQERHASFLSELRNELQVLMQRLDDQLEAQSADLLQKQQRTLVEFRFRHSKEIDCISAQRTK